MVRGRHEHGPAEAALDVARVYRMLRDAARKEPVPADVNVRAACGGSTLGPHEGDEDPGLVVILPPQRKHTLRGDDAGGTVAWAARGS